MGKRKGQAPPKPITAEAEPLALASSATVPRVVLRGLAGPLNIYRKRLVLAPARIRAGGYVAVYNEQDQLLGYGWYNPRSEIAVRMVSWGTGVPDTDYWADKIRRAIDLRQQVLRLDRMTDAYRVIHAEADGFPGLMVDRYGPVLSAEAFSLAAYLRAETVLQELAALLGTEHWQLRPGPQTLAQEGFEFPSRASAGCPEEVTISEYGTHFRIRFQGGHKTGFFCDQRDNRRLLAEFCAEKTVLDLCCYTGGFAIQAKTLGQAAQVTGVDLDAEPLQLARENAQRNQLRQIQFVQADVFGYMRDLLRHGKRFDVVVLDPPKLIRNRGELEEGTKKHFDLNRLAMQVVQPGGLLLTCSCAGLLADSQFNQLVTAAARQLNSPAAVAWATGATESLHHPADETNEADSTAPPAAKLAYPFRREAQILARTGAAPDHPVATHFPESEYLKAIWLRLH